MFTFIIIFLFLLKVKVVTLKGHVISKTGSMTGGTSGRDGSDRWEEKVSACKDQKYLS